MVLATRNAHKVIELRRILHAAGLESVELIGLDAYPDLPDVPETGATFEANALLKASAVAAATGLIAVADDSGLAVDALGGMPGVLSARWSGGLGDAANLQLVLAQIADVPDDRRGASFECAAAAVVPDGAQVVVRGQLTGSITRTPRGTNGFGYDPIFVPTGSSRTTAELDPDEKDAISHRGVAFRALAARLHEIWASG
jgi:XTP/dITP diphosphohydrolase